MRRKIPASAPERAAAAACAADLPTTCVISRPPPACGRWRKPTVPSFPAMSCWSKEHCCASSPCSLRRGKQQLPAETADTQRLKAVLQWISVHYAEGLRVADADRVCSFSSSHFMRWFRQMTGQSFVAFLNEYRLNAAAEALHATDETVLTIASRCGFENLSYFNRGVQGTLRHDTPGVPEKISKTRPFRLSEKERERPRCF